jgi:hypothetical protein
MVQGYAVRHQSLPERIPLHHATTNMSWQLPKRAIEQMLWNSHSGMNGGKPSQAAIASQDPESVRFD